MAQSLAATVVVAAKRGHGLLFCAPITGAVLGLVGVAIQKGAMQGQSSLHSTHSTHSSIQMALHHCTCHSRSQHSSSIHILGHARKLLHQRKSSGSCCRTINHSAWAHANKQPLHPHSKPLLPRSKPCKHSSKTQLHSMPSNHSMRSTHSMRTLSTARTPTATHKHTAGKQWHKASRVLV